MTMKPGRWSTPLVSVSLLPLLGACAGWDGTGHGYDRATWVGSSSSSSSSTSSTSLWNSATTTDSASTAKSYSERTDLNRNGSVTIIQRDPDGTRTLVDSMGNVRVDPPGYGSCHRHGRR